MMKNLFAITAFIAAPMAATLYTRTAYTRTESDPFDENFIVGLPRQRRGAETQRD